MPYDGQVSILKNYFSEKQSQKFMAKIPGEVIWRNDKITMFGKTYPQARKVAWHGDEGLTYIYTRIKMVSPGWTETLKEITEKVSREIEHEFNSALVNYYRDGKDHMSWHRDDEPELNKNPVIASVSFGASRDFYFKHNDGEQVHLSLDSGDLLIMAGETQTYWKHALPKRLKVDQPRMNITLRKIFE